MPRYDVTWSNSYDADSYEEAVEQAVGDLADVVRNRRGPSIFVVYYRKDGRERRVPYDIEFEEVV